MHVCMYVCMYPFVGMASWFWNVLVNRVTVYGY